MDVNHLGSQEDVVSSWVSAHSLVEESIYEADIAAAPCLPALAVTSLSVSGKGGLVHSQLALLWYLPNPLFCEWTRLHISLLG